MESTLVFLDGGFMSKLNFHFGNDNYIRYDLIKFARNLAKKQGLFCKHIFYYNAPNFLILMLLQESWLKSWGLLWSS